IKVSKRCLGFPERAEHKTADKPGLDKVRLQRDGSIVSSERIAVLQHLRKDVPTAKPSFSVVAIQRQRPVISRQRLLIMPQHTAPMAAAKPGFGKIRFHGKRAFESS